MQSFAFLFIASKIIQNYCPVFPLSVAVFGKSLVTFANFLSGPPKVIHILSWTRISCMHAVTEGIIRYWSASENKDDIAWHLHNIYIMLYVTKQQSLLLYSLPYLLGWLHILYIVIQIISFGSFLSSLIPLSAWFAW